FTAAEAVGPVQAPELSGYPLATQDVALVVNAAVPAAEVEAALVAGAPKELLEGVRLFDVYTGAQVGEDRKSLAYTLRFRAPDRTLTAAEATAGRDAARGGAARGRSGARVEPPGRRRPAQLVRSARSSQASFAVSLTGK